MLRRGCSYIGTLCCLLAAAATAAADSHAPGKAAESAEEAKPLKVGEMLPDVKVTREDGEKTTLPEALDGQPAALVFYRGHWCPFCMKHLASLQEIAGNLKESGVKLIAVTPDKPEFITEAKKKASLSYDIYSDGDLAIAKAMGVAFKLDPETAERYSKVLTESTGHDSGQLPVPAVFLIDKDGKIAFVHANPDYKKRLANEDLLAAAKDLKS